MRRALALGCTALLLASCGASARARGAAGTSPWAERADIPRVAVPIEGAPSQGASAPLVTVVVFSDFECPHCRDAAPALAGLLAQGSVRLYFRHLPLPFHEHAALAAEAAEEARAQGGDPAFWRYHDALLTGGVREPDLIAHASRLGLDAARFRIALRGRVHREGIERDLALADALGVDGTPTVFVNGRVLLGVPPGGELAAIIDEELALASEAVARGIDRAELYARVLAEARPSLRSPAAHEVLEPPAEEERAPEPLPEGEQRARIAAPPDAPRRGAARPRLVVQVFSDFECSFCRDVRPTLERVLAEHPEVQLVFRHYPLPFHRSARAAAIAAIEVHRQLGDEGFWRFHDLLFESRAALGRDALLEHASRVGADAERVAQALDGGRHTQIIDADIAAVTRAGIRIGTPAFLIGERVLLGAQPFEAFDRAIAEELATAENAGVQH